MLDGTHDVDVRDARPGEREAIADLTWQSYGEYARLMAPDAWRALEGALRSALASEDPGAERVVAVLGEAIIGSAMLFAPGTTDYEGVPVDGGAPEMRLLAVSPAARGLGIGERLVTECAARARRMGARELGLHTSRSMSAAIALYVRLGFERAPGRDFQPEGAEVVEGYVLRL